MMIEVSGCIRFGAVVQLVRTLACHARGRGFEPRRPRHCLIRTTKLFCIPLAVLLPHYDWDEESPKAVPVMPDEHEDGKHMPHMECVLRRFFQGPVCPIWLLLLNSLVFPVSYYYLLCLFARVFQNNFPGHPELFRPWAPYLSEERIP